MMNIFLEKIATTRKIYFLFFFSTLILAFFYRLVFLVQTWSEPYDYYLFASSFGFLSDLIVCIGLTLISYSFQLLFAIIFQDKALHFIIGLINLAGFLILTLAYIINLEISSTLFIGLNYTILLSYLSQGATVLDLGFFINRFDVFFYLVLASVIS